MFPEPLAERLPQDCPAIQIKRLLDDLDLRDVRELYEDHGGIAYDPKCLLGVLLLSYMLGVYASRQMEDRCRFDLRFIHVSGRQTPDYRTLARFRRRIEPVLESLFEQVLKKCLQAGLAPLKLGALDGTKLAANSSQLRRFLTKEADEEASDPDARVLKGFHGYMRGYNVQALVDTQHGVVLSTQVSNAANDYAQLEPTLQGADKALGKVPECTVADAGYESAQNLEIAETLGTEAMLAPKDDSALFWTAVSDTEVVCPMGQPLEYLDTFLDARGRPTDRYGVKGCASCMFVSSCCGKTARRTLRVAQGVSPVLPVLNAHRCRSPEGRLAMGARRSTVEPLFGHWKSNKRFSRFHLRGLAGARTEILLLATTRNLEVLQSALAALFWWLLGWLGRIQSPKRQLSGPVSS